MVSCACETQLYILRRELSYGRSLIRVLHGSVDLLKASIKDIFEPVEVIVRLFATIFYTKSV